MDALKAFTNLYTALDETNKTNEKIEAMRRYFAAADPADAAWAIYFLSGRKPRQIIPTAKLVQWAVEAAQIPNWLFDESYLAVGDLAEAIALLLPTASASSDLPLHRWVEERLYPLRGLAETSQREAVRQAWAEMDDRQRYVWNKLITGSFRVGVSQQLVTRALAQLSGIEAEVVAHRLMGEWEPTPDFYQRLLHPDTDDAALSRPYPFFLAYPLEDGPEVLGDIGKWQVEWKWDGIRSQLIRRAGQTFIWSRGEDLITERFPELAELAVNLPDGTVIDGEILPWHDKVMPFAQLQQRIGRKTLTKKILSNVPVILLTYDLLEYQGQDVRAQPLWQRRMWLAELVMALADDRLRLSPLAEAGSWAELASLRETSRERGIEGFMLKRFNSPYRVGRQRGDWWKWKIEPYTVDAVLIYAQHGHGRRASLYTDYTFAVWDNGQLVPFAKAYSGLTDAEINQVDRFVRQNTVDKFGPVRSVTPKLVFELAFENIQRSNRHKSGLAVRFPRILRWRTDKPIEEADSLETIKAMLPEK
jgi:DNA ligase 1